MQQPSPAQSATPASTSSQPPALRIDVISDVVCPWCFIGKRRLERALELYRSAYPEASAPDLRFHPFELNPDLPPAGVLRRDYYARKFGPEKVAQIYARIQGVGRELDIPFALEEIQKQPNTRRMHVLISLAAGFGLQERVKEAFLCAFFLDALDLTERDNLERIATDAGLPLEVVQAALDDPAALQTIQAQEEQATAIGVQGVPFFIFNGCVAVSGAQEPQALFDAMQQALRESAAAANAPEQPAQSSQSAQRV